MPRTKMGQHPCIYSQHGMFMAILVTDDYERSLVQPRQKTSGRLPRSSLKQMPWLNAMDKHGRNSLAQDRQRVEATKTWPKYPCCRAM